MKYPTCHRVSDNLMVWNCALMVFVEEQIIYHINVCYNTVLWLSSPQVHRTHESSMKSPTRSLREFWLIFVNSRDGYRGT